MSKLIYILNHYSSDHASHFNHVVDFLEGLAKSGVDIVLIIERADPNTKISSAFKVIIQQRRSTLGRMVELWRILARLRKQGYTKTFVRISNIAGVVTSLASLLSSAESYFWKSGETLEFEREKPFNSDKLRWYLTTYWPLKFTARYCSFFVTGPEHMKTYVEHSLGVDPDKIKVLYNDINLERFQSVLSDTKSQLRSKLGLPINKTIILFSHRFSPVRKTYMYFPQILEPLIEREDVHLCLIGDGPEQETVISSIQKYFSDRMTVLGQVPNKKMHSYYQAADLFINPSHAEGFPRVILEAMATGLPIVTTDAGGVYDILGHEQQQYITRRNDVAAFGEALYEVYSSADIQTKLSAENLESVKRFSTPNVITMFKQVILDENSPPL